MKKLIMMLVLMCLVSNASCMLSASSSTAATVNKDKSANGIEQTDADTTEATVSATDEKEKQADITVGEQVLLDQDGVKVTLKSFGSDDLFGPSLKVLIENNSDKSVTIQAINSVINGLMVTNMFSCDIESGKKANEEIVFMTSELEVSGIEKIKDIEFSFNVFDTESWETIFISDTVNITTSVDPSYVQSYDDSGFVALEKDGYKVVIKRLDSEDSFWGADIYVFIENTSDQDVTIQTRNMSVNGFMMEPMFSADVLAGKRAFTTMTFMESDLKDNDIQSIETLEFDFTIFNKDSWDTILDSDTITVSFDK